MVDVAHHSILLRGLQPLGNSGGPVLLKRTDQELIPVLLDQLEHDADLASVRTTVASRPQGAGTLRLYQPVQRTFYIALFEAVCDLPGYPRVDPAAIASAGMVVRRTGRGGTAQGWLAQQASLRGWLDLNDTAAGEDPDPEQRRTLSTGNDELDWQLALLRRVTSPLAEAVTPLFVAPPAVCKRLGKTVLYGLVPVTSGEFSERPAANVPAGGIDSPAFTQQLTNHLPPTLRTGAPAANLTAGRRLTKADAQGTDPQVQLFITVLRQLAVELDAFGPGPDAVALFGELNKIQLAFPDGSRQGLGTFLKAATAVLVEAKDGQVIWPSVWPTPTTVLLDRIKSRVVGALAGKAAAGEQGEQRFARPDAFYSVRGFVRVDRANGCPPELFWSQPSVQYQIAPWYENANTGLPLPRIELPDPFDPKVRSSFKPNVSFRVPDKLFAAMNAMDAKKALKGEIAENSGSFGLDWICSFSIPIITICAFIVLNIFLSLFDLFLHWMMLIKICIPVPKRTA
ncbi:MAG: hypothetical protein U0X20_22960 [Caldilineaceae bacterium]